MNEEELHNAVFRFKHKAPSDCQDAVACQALVKEFVTFVSTLKAVEIPGHICSRFEPLADDRMVPVSDFAVHEVDVLQEVSQRLTDSSQKHKRGDVWYDPWLPQYGCVIQRTQKTAMEITIEVVYIDEWKHQLHFLPTGKCVHSAVPSNQCLHAPQCCVDLDTELEAKFSTLFASKLLEAQKIRGSERSAAKNELGHQKTPQFIAAIVKHCVVSLIGRTSDVDNISMVVQGGTTDVGRHTGGRARDTCWAIVQEAIARNLCCGEGLFRKSMVVFKLKLLQKAVHKTKGGVDSDSINLVQGCARVDDIFFMLQTIIQDTVELVESKYEVSALHKQCAALRLDIDAIADILNYKTAVRYRLPDARKLKQLNKLTSSLSLMNPKQTNDSDSCESSKKRHQRAWANLEGCYYINGASCSLDELLQWKSTLSCPETYQCNLILRTFETFIFKRSLQLIDDSPIDNVLLDFESMHSFVTQYQSCARRQRQLQSMPSILDKEQRSCEMLIVWTAFCLVHQHCVIKEIKIKKYKIALDWRDLKVAIVRDQTAISALQCVAKYIRSWNKTTYGKPLFHLTDQDPTFEFGKLFGLKCTSMLNLYDRVCETWDSHVRKQWRNIEQKKQKAIELRAKIDRQKANADSKRLLLADEIRNLNLMYHGEYFSRRYRYSTTRTRLENEIAQVESAIKNTEHDLRKTLAMPSYLVRPLPPSQADAIQIIFMLTMPRYIEILGSLCMTAQRSLAPTTSLPEMLVLPKVSPTSWYEYYTMYAPTPVIPNTSTVFTASPSPFSCPCSWGPTSVDQLSSLSQYCSECIWDPSINCTALTWKDFDGTRMNPFAATETSVIDSFTMKLPAEYNQFQWMNEWPIDDGTRGNMVYANFHLQPENFEKTAFIALGSLRAFPNQQFRKLQWALLDDVLPWSNVCVKTIVRQSLYQVGFLTDDATPEILWKTDMYHNEKGLDTFCATLEIVAQKLEQTPRNYESVLLLSEMAGFALQYTKNARRLVYLFGGMARRWAENARLEYKKELSPRRIGEIRQKECILLSLALLSYTLGSWDDKVAQEVCELIVLFRTSFLCASISLSSSNEMILREREIHELMCRRIAEWIAYINKRGMDMVLTGLVRLVSATSPKSLKWKQFSEVSAVGKQFGSCFEAIDRAKNVHYSVNVFTGVVLIDGYAPGGLPVEIRRHERFQVLFGPSNFEVYYTNGVHRTQRDYYDRFYDFSLKGDGDLFVQELLVDSSGIITCTLQLCSNIWIKAMSDVLPIRLQELYSHWYWVEENCVLFRPKEAKCRETFYIATYDEQTRFHCYQVPFCDTKHPYKQLLGLCIEYDQFVEKDKVIADVFNNLTKFESLSYLHPLRSSTGVLNIELPRAKLGFFLNKKMQFESVEHNGYVLATTQQLYDFLPRFNQYLLLELQDESDTARPELRMLVPVGSVKESDVGTVDILLPTEAGSHVEVHYYDVHRRLKTFQTETIGARLQMAAVCARAGLSVPSRRLQMTGEEAALQMLLSCRSSRPYSDYERMTLLTIYELSYREPAVKILAVMLLREAYCLAFLFGQTAKLNCAMASIDERTEYADMCLQLVKRNPLRSQFRSREEKFVVGNIKHSCVPVPVTEVISCDPVPVAKNYVQSIECKLKQFVCIEGKTTNKIPPLPLNTGTANAMSKEMLDDLQVSWKTYNSRRKFKLKATPKALRLAFTKLLGGVSSKRVMMEEYLNDSYIKSLSNKRDQLLLLGNFLPILTVMDLVQCSFDEETLRALAPKLSERARQKFRAGIHRYMELCVLEDKVERLIWKAKRSSELSDAQMVEELLNHRQWHSKTFPYWLAFEVEGRLQIRHEQYVIAQHLINRPGTVCQLNMGRGKTRVILPMLFLYYTRNLCSKVVRAHFLSPLLSEARQFMHRYLSASSVRLSIFEQPFHRQIDLDARRLEIIRDCLHKLKLSGGIQIVAPEHRMSLELKRLELGSDGCIVDTLDEILDNDQFLNVLDECDALLHHKYHLVYAVGTSIPLCSGIERWKAAEALLHVVSDQSLESRVARVLRTAHVSSFAPDYSTRLGAYNGTRLTTVVESTAAQREELKKALVLELIDHAPFELMWLSFFGSTSARNSLIRAIVQSTVSLKEALDIHFDNLAPHFAELLALRGLVAFGVLEHCLEKRYRVNFGLPNPGTRSRKIAIPYRAADVPSDRSEFSHPDVCIVLTLLGYYHRGLTSEEVRSTFQMLLRLDISEQQYLYNRWFQSVESGLSQSDQKALGDVCHISLADTKQFQTLLKTYKFCMEAINFFLNTCVFPKDTHQYPQRMSRTAWNLVPENFNVGFSGTNDNQRLLPLSVTQREPNEPSLLGTNGEMIDKILRVTHSYDVIRSDPNSKSIPWQSVLLFAINKKAQALIDTGALLAGVLNHDAAKFLLERPEFDFGGVTYYDSREENACWMIAEKARRIEVPHKKASMLERETFVIFDEARSRGSDLKLLPGASAVLTLGPKLTKDKLMQGAGRMRQLGCNQSLWLASFDEVAQSIRQISGHNPSCLSAIDVLNWVMDNTKEEAVRGLLEWGSNGLHYQKTQLNRDYEIVNENWELKTLYQDKVHVDSIAQVIQSKASLNFQDLPDIVSQICKRGFVYGLDDEICITCHTDECERELQLEEEVQQERELELTRCSPTHEKKWAYERILNAQSVSDLSALVQVFEMTQFVSRSILPKEMAHLSWDETRVFGTSNFFATIRARNAAKLNNYLRVIDVVLVFRHGDILLVSECEADHILKLLWSNRATACNFCFLNLAFACESLDRVGVSTIFRDAHLTLGSGLDQKLPLISVIACHIYNGETSVAKHQEDHVKHVYRKLLGPLVMRESTLCNYVKSRGNFHKWTRSLLHQLCCRLDLELGLISSGQAK